jgi:hypothetical protein
MTPEEMQAEMERLKTMGTFGPQQLPQMPQMPGANYQPGAVNNIQSAVNQSMMPAATIPQAMQPMQPLQMPQAPQAPQAPQEKPGLLSRIGSGIQDFVQDKDRMMDLAATFNSMRFAPDAGIQQAYADRQKMRTVSSQANQTAAYLRQQGQPELAAMVEANPALAKDALAEFTKKKMGTNYASKNIGSIQVAQEDMTVGSTQLKAGDQYVITYDPNAEGGYSVTKLGTRGVTEREQASLEVTTQEELADRKLAGDKGLEIDQRISGVSEQLYIMSNMLDLLNSDRPEDEVRTGFLTNFMPTVRAGTATFESMANTLGIAVINSATFGALSATELKLALDTAIPTNLSPESMKKYIEDKIAVNEKLMNAMLDKQSALLAAGSYKQFQKDENARMKENLAIMKQVPAGMNRQEWRDLSADQRKAIIRAGD